VINKENKTFSIYIAEEGDKSQSSILFGGHDEEGFLNPNETITMQADSNYAVSMTNFTIGSEVTNLTNG
jgi:hypothetical protein